MSPDIDFGRSHLYFRTTRVNHTPRLLLDAACTLRQTDGTEKTYYLTCACIGEAMYVQTGLIHEPVAQFNLIAEPRRQFLMIKRHASAAHDIRSAQKFGDVMPTHDGKGAKMVDLDVKVSRHARTTPITTYEQFRDALLNNRLINARTTYTDDNGKSTVIMDYPCKTVNVAHDKPAWQVDAGPVLMPAVSGPVTLEVERLDQAFIVYNRFDYAECVIRRRTSLGTDPAAGENHHYSLRRNLTCRHELFEVE